MLKKCKVLRITRKPQKTEYPYKLHDTVLKSTVYVWDFRVCTSFNLTRSKDVENLRPINQYAQLREEIHSKHIKDHLGLLYFVFDSGMLETMLCISSLGSTIRRTDQTHGKNTKACEQVYFRSTIHLRC